MRVRGRGKERKRVKDRVRERKGKKKRARAGEDNGGSKPSASSSGPAVAKEAVPSACEVPPGSPTKTKKPVRCSTKICVRKQKKTENKKASQKWHENILIHQKNMRQQNMRQKIQKLRQEPEKH